MALFAEWDPETKNVVAIRNDGADPGQPQVSGVTGAARAIGGQTEWYPLEVEYPETYVPRFPMLLGQSTMQLEGDGVVRQRFPNADFSEAAVRDALVREVNGNAQVVLNQTDWYVTRYIELDKKIPDEVRAHRADIRAQVDTLRAKIAKAKPSELLDFDTMLFSEPGVVATPLPTTVGHRIQSFPPRIEPTE